MTTHFVAYLDDQDLIRVEGGESVVASLPFTLTSGSNTIELLPTEEEKTLRSPLLFSARLSYAACAWGGRVALGRARGYAALCFAEGERCAADTGRAFAASKRNSGATSCRHPLFLQEAQGTRRIVEGRFFGLRTDSATTEGGGPMAQHSRGLSHRLAAKTRTPRLGFPDGCGHLLQYLRHHLCAARSVCRAGTII